MATHIISSDPNQAIKDRLIHLSQQDDVDPAFRQTAVMALHRIEELERLATR